MYQSLRSKNYENPVGSMFFNFDAGRNVSICKINGCQKPELVGKHSSNLEKHIHDRHNDEYQLLMTAKNNFAYFIIA